MCKIRLARCSAIDPGSLSYFGEDEDKEHNNGELESANGCSLQLNQLKLFRYIPRYWNTNRIFRSCPSSIKILFSFLTSLADILTKQEKKTSQSDRFVRIIYGLEIYRCVVECYSEKRDDGEDGDREDDTNDSGVF